MNKYIRNRIEKTAEDNWDTYRSIFRNDYKLYRDSLETVYAYIANRTVREMNKNDIRIEDEYDIYRLSTVNIHCDILRKLCPTKKIEGKVFRISHETLLHILTTSGIIYQNKKYKVGKFTKSYSLSNDFIRQVIASCEYDNAKLYESFLAYYPNRLLKKMSEEVKELFKTSKRKRYIEKLDFTKGFFDKVSTFGWYYDDDRLDVEEMHRDLKTYIGHDSGHYTDYRYYDWFTSVSSAFRSHITIEGHHYRECYDFHAGMFWMLSIWGYLKGHISSEECERMIDHAFYGKFYEDISEAEKTKSVKQKFMVYANGHRGIHKQVYESGDDIFSNISRNFWKMYPEWSKMLHERRINLKGDIGLENFLNATQIEKDLYLRIKERLENKGLTNIRRVHDAIYTLEDVEDIEDIARDVIDDYMSSKKIDILHN